MGECTCTNLLINPHVHLSTDDIISVCSNSTTNAVLCLMPDDFSHQQICAEMHAFGGDQVLGNL